MDIRKHVIDKKPMQRLKHLMWNGLPRIKIYNNHVI
jgi:hypothetical protein